MKKIKLSNINHVIDIKKSEKLEGAGYFDIIINGDNFKVGPNVRGCDSKSVAIYDHHNWFIVVGDQYYDGHLHYGTPCISFDSEAKPATELYKRLGFEIDLEA